MNEQVAVREQQRDEKAGAWFESLLSDQLFFRRTTGTVDKRQAFLNRLNDRSPFSSRDSKEINLIGLEHGRAIAFLVVWTKDVKNAEHRYRNIRLFSKQH